MNVSIFCLVMLSFVPAVSCTTSKQRVKDIVGTAGPTFQAKWIMKIEKNLAAEVLSATQGNKNLCMAEGERGPDGFGGFLWLANSDTGCGEPGAQAIVPASIALPLERYKPESTTLVEPYIVHNLAYKGAPIGQLENYELFSLCTDIFSAFCTLDVSGDAPAIKFR